jgi:hypothetical protein
MQYILFIYENEADYDSRSEAQNGTIFQEYLQLNRKLRDAGEYRSGERLQPVGTATTVRVRDGKTLTTDGPFAETREQLGGYYIIEAKDLDAAVSIAAKVPGARYGSIEVRPIRPMPSNA